MREVQEGDPKYLAPEVLRGSQNISAAADIFSLGMSILELATDLDLPRGGEPWHRLREGEIPADLIAELSSELIHIIRQMIDGDHLRRARVHELLEMTRIKREIARQKRHALMDKIVWRRRQWMTYISELIWNFWCFLTLPCRRVWRYLVGR